MPSWASPCPMHLGKAAATPGRSHVRHPMCYHAAGPSWKAIPPCASRTLSQRHAAPMAFTISCRCCPLQTWPTPPSTYASYPMLPSDSLPSFFHFRSSVEILPAFAQTSANVAMQLLSIQHDQRILLQYAASQGAGFETWQAIKHPCLWKGITCSCDHNSFLSNSSCSTLGFEWLSYTFYIIGHRGRLPAKFVQLNITELSFDALGADCSKLASTKYAVAPPCAGMPINSSGHTPDPTLGRTCSQVNGGSSQPCAALCWQICQALGASCQAAGAS